MTTYLIREMPEGDRPRERLKEPVWWRIRVHRHTSARSFRPNPLA